MLLSIDGLYGSDATGGAAALVTASVSAEVSASPSLQSASFSFSATPSSFGAPVALGPDLVPGLRQRASSGVRNYSIVSRSAMILRDQDGNVLSSLDGGEAGSIYFGGSNTDGEPTGPSQDVRDEQAHEFTPEGMAALPHVPWSPDFSLKGTLSPDRGWMSFTVPVGPYTNTLRLAVSSEHDGSAMPAMVDQMYLMDSKGRLVAELTGIATVSSSSTQTLTVSIQSAPSGGALLIRLIVTPQDDSDGSSGDGGSPITPDTNGGIGALTPPPSQTSNGFTVEVQRDDGPFGSPSPSVASPSLALPPGTYLPSTSGSDFSHFGSGSSTSPTNTAPAVEPGYAANATNWSNYVGGAGGRASREPIDLEPESESISLGPLVSRGRPRSAPRWLPRPTIPLPRSAATSKGGVIPPPGVWKASLHGGRVRPRRLSPRPAPHSTPRRMTTARRLRP